ncbi:MAG TPA: LPS export ABC transporter periplasmic protein LptC [Salinivirgaceae bacterium]|nr:LPS export ABC transporter periplasmic protein LptC [Salinivirgaceae bacterium]HQA75778.1 LPS export ABC transporter periplasmic protein LptC [Salinivirgaceae bacterium]
MINKISYSKKPSRIATILVAVLFLFNACAEGIHNNRNIPDIVNYPGLSANKVELLHSQYGTVKLKVKAQTVNVFSYQEEPKTEFPDGIVVEFFDDSMNVTSYLSANKAVYYEKDNRWEAIGNVEAKNIEGTLFNTEYIEWDEKTELIKSDRFIKVTEKDAIILGRGFRAKQDFTDWKIFDISGDFSINKSEFYSDDDVETDTLMDIYPDIK